MRQFDGVLTCDRRIENISRSHPDVIKEPAMLRTFVVHHVDLDAGTAPTTDEFEAETLLEAGEICQVAHPKDVVLDIYPNDDPLR